MFGQNAALVRELTQQLALANGKLLGMERTITSLEATMDWLRTRLTQVEHERALLIQNYMGITIKVPQIDRAPKQSTAVEELLSSRLFDDVGEAEALRLGITHNADGTVSYRAKEQTNG